MDLTPKNEGEKSVFRKAGFPSAYTLNNDEGFERKKKQKITILPRTIPTINKDYVATIKVPNKLRV